MKIKAIIKCANEINSIINTIIRTQSYLIDEESIASVELQAKANRVGTKLIREKSDENEKNNINENEYANETRKKNEINTN